MSDASGAGSLTRSVMPELRKPSTCPKCGGHDIKRVVGGRPTPEAREMVQREEAVLGTCFESFDRPDWHCAACRHQWFDRTDPARQEMEALLQRILDKR